MKALIVKEDGLIYVNEVPEEPEYNGEIGHSINVQKQYYEQLEVAKKNAVLVSDQEKATKLLIEADVLFSANTDKPKPKPGIYPIPDLQWDVVDVKIARALSTGGKHKQMPLNGEVAILKQSLPTDHEILNEAGSDLQNIKAWMRDMNYNNSAVFWDSEDNTVLRVADIIQHYLQWIGTEQQVAILKESTPSTEQESQEDLINELIHETFGASLAGREAITKKFIITRKP